jgi:Putative DNA-binding domain
MNASFCAALFDAALPPPPGIKVWNGADPASRFGVYRNNVIASLINALADTFPVTQALVGEPFFRAMAKLYVHAEPPQSKILAFYGDTLARFIEQFPPAASLPYLADVARFEMQWIKTVHAADAQALPDKAIEQLLAQPAQLPQLRVTFQASVGLIRSAYAVHSLWAAHQGDDGLMPQSADAAENVLFVRPALVVELTRLAPSTADFIGRLQTGACLGDAFVAVSAMDPAFDLNAAITLLFQTQAIQTLHT